MRGYVEAYEVYEANLPEGVEPDEDYFFKIFRGEQPLESLVSLANKTRKGMSLANNLETHPPKIPNLSGVYDRFKLLLER